MAEGKLDLPDDLLSSKSSYQSWTSKVEVSGGHHDNKVLMGSADELKDPAASDSSIPLSPQWLYAKPVESKLEMRGPTSLGNSTDSNQKEGWRLEGSEDKKDWRRPATESENSRRWREEERETSLLGGRRDRRKTERRAENIPLRDTTDSRTLPTTDRWQEGRNEVRRDTKWSSRWGPDDKDKEPRTEKRTDVEKDDAQNNSESQSLGANNRLAADRESDSRDKWRPRHRMEVHTLGSGTYRAAPGFGLERGRVEGSNMGFTLGRGRSSGIGRSAGTIGAALSGNSDSFPGKPRHSADDFRYPRGKLLDIYRQRKPELSFDTIPDEMEESPSLTQVDLVEPLAFHSPDANEEAILNDIWKGKITSSGVVYNSFKKGRSTENITGVGDLEAADGVLGNLPSTVTQTSAFQEASNADDYGTLWNYGSQRNVINEKDVDHEETDNRATEGNDLDGMSLSIQKSNGVYCDVETDGSYDGANQLHVSGSRKTEDSAFSSHPVSDDVEFANYSEIRSKLPDVSNTVYGLASSGQNDNSNPRVKGLEMGVHPESLCYYYLDPQGVTQGPYQGLDIISWFEQGFFGTDLLVRLEDAPEGTPFKELGEFMPYLKSWDENGSIRSPNSKLEKSSCLGGSLESSLPFSSAVSDSNYTFLGHDHHGSLPEQNKLSAQHIQPRISEPEAPMQLHSRGQSFNDFVEQEEDIVFPGIHGTTAYSTARSSGSIHDPVANSINHLPPPTEVTESGVPIQNDNKLHPFGLLWSEIESGQSKHIKLSNMPSSKGRAVPFSSNHDPAIAETWSNLHRKSSVSDLNMYQEMLTPRQLSHMEHEPSHYDLAEQLMLQQIRQQQQLQQRNMLSNFAHLNDGVLDPLQNHNLIHHQQFANHSSADLDHILALQMQQRQAQLEQHQLQQQQQFHQQQKLLQEKQQSQVLFEQLLCGQMHDPTLRQQHVDPIRANNALDQVLFEQQLLREIQQRSHHLPRHVDTTMEQLIQAKFGHTPQGHQTDLLELMSCAQHEQIQSLEHQMHARQLPMGIRQRMEEERHIGSVWPAEEANHIFRTRAGNHGHRGHSSGFNPVDFYQRQQRPSHEEQLNHLDRNLSLQDQLQQGLYEPGSLPFERSMSLPAGAPGVNLDAINAMARAQGLDMQDSIGRMQSAGQSGQFSSGIPSHNAHHPNQFHVSHLDAIEGHWPEKNDRLENDWMDSRFQQLHINAERQKREAEIKNTSQDPNLWMSDGINDENSKRLLMELLHQKSGHQPSGSLNVTSNGMFTDKRLPSGHFSGSNSSNHIFNLRADQEASQNNSFCVGSFGSNPGEFQQEELASSVDSNEKLMYRSNSGALSDRESFLAGMNATCQSLYTNSNMISKSSIGKEVSELEGRKRASKSEGIMNRSLETQERMIEQAGLSAPNFEERSKHSHSMNSYSVVSGVNAGFYDKIGRSSSFVEEIAKDRVPIPAKGLENILLRRPPVPSTSASQEGSSDLISDSVIRGKSSSAASDWARRDTVVNPVNQGSDVMTSSKKEMHFCRTSSTSDADVSEASFIDMLKNNTTKIAPMNAHTTTGYPESSEAMQGGRGGKKKGKKGRQIDPALLGFKVTSNRIMMGEIQRIDD